MGYNIPRKKMIEKMIFCFVSRYEDWFRTELGRVYSSMGHMALNEWFFSGCTWFTMDVIKKENEEDDVKYYDYLYHMGIDPTERSREAIIQEFNELKSALLSDGGCYVYLDF